MLRPISGGGLGLSCKCSLCFLRVNDVIHRQPVVGASPGVVKSGIALVAILLESTRYAHVVIATGMVAVGPTVAAHAS